MKDTSNQRSTPVENNQKKQWIEPNIEIISHDNIASGHHSGATEANYAPGQPASSTLFFKFFS